MNHLRSIFISLSVIGLLLPGPVFAGKTPAAQMQQILFAWPPENWQTTAPGSNTPFPPYIGDGEFSGTIYHLNAEEKLWSAHISISDQQTKARSTQMLNNFPNCEASSVNGYPARICTTTGESLGRRRVAYVAGRYLVEISVIGPLPLELPALNLNAALIDKTSDH